jgi:hypothetical protein
MPRLPWTELSSQEDANQGSREDQIDCIRGAILLYAFPGDCTLVPGRRRVDIDQLKITSMCDSPRAHHLMSPDLAFPPDHVPAR